MRKREEIDELKFTSLSDVFTILNHIKKTGHLDSDFNYKVTNNLIFKIIEEIKTNEEMNELLSRVDEKENPFKK